MREWKREDCVYVCTSECVQAYVCVSVLCMCLMHHVGFCRSLHGDRAKLTERCAPSRENTEYVLKISHLTPFVPYCTMRTHRLRAEKLAASQNAVPCFVSVIRTSATTSSKCWFPETTTWCSSVVPTASTPCADTTGSVSSARTCHGTFTS